MTSLAFDTAILAQQYEELSDKQYNHGKLLIQDLCLDNGQQILDVGCGTGRLAEYVAGLVGNKGNVIGIDPLPLRVDLARRQRAAANLSFQEGRSENLSEFPDESFDAVYLNSVFHWLPEKNESLTEAYRVLKAGGRLGISTASKERPHDFEQIARAIITAPPYNLPESTTVSTLYKVTVDDLTALFKQVGFKVKSIEIRTFTDYFEQPETVIDFSNSSSFGNFLSSLTSEQRESAIEKIKSKLETRRGPQGITLERHLIFAVAEKL